MAPERTDDQQRRAVIHAAAIREFSARGFSRTSMANIADAAGMSRPALYLHFENKGDIFASAFTAIIDESVDRALDALSAAATVAGQLDGMLQRFDGDLWEQMAASPHSQEILDAKYAHAAHAADDGHARLRTGLVAYLKRQGAPAARRSEWLDLLELAPRGFKLDQPTVAVFRRRLTTLARAVAADLQVGAIEAGTRPRTRPPERKRARS